MTDPLGYIIDKWNLDHALMNDPPIMIPKKNRTMLAVLFSQLGYEKGAEIGTAKGSYARVIARFNPNCRLYCIDPWESYSELKDWQDQDQLDEYYLGAKWRLRDYPEIRIIKSYSMDALQKFDDESLDFVYIDANHGFPYVAEDVYYWSQKVRAGGIVSGHDYLRVPRKDGIVQVKEVVDAYTAAFKIKKWFVVDECTEDRAGSWFWVKQ